MEKDIRILYIPVTGDMEVRFVSRDYEDYQELVHRYARTIEHVLGDCILVVNEEAGMNENKRINFRASNLYGSFLYGDAVLTNLDMISDDERDFVSLEDSDIQKCMLELHIRHVEGFSLQSIVIGEPPRTGRMGRPRIVFVSNEMSSTEYERRLENSIIQGETIGFSMGAPEIPKLETIPSVKEIDKEFNIQKAISETHPFKAFGGTSKKDLNKYKGHRRKK